LIGTREWANDNWFNYQLAAKVNTGVGLSLGYVDVDRVGSQTYQRASLRSVYNVSARADLNASVGTEWRQYDEGDWFGPVFSLGGNYSPRDGTVLSLQGSRQNQASALLAGQNYISTGISASIRQRIIERLFLTVSGSFQNAEYQATSAGVTATRNDDQFLIRTALDTILTAQWRAGAYYMHRRNESNLQQLEFARNQVGIQTSYQF
jgi:hypothetical protein